jgi:site-specific DNA-cytosine methylase
LVKAGAQDDNSWWLVVAGWPCEDLSTAGNCTGLSGPRSRTFWQLIHIVSALQQLQPDRPPVYMLENSPIQHNWKDTHIREVDSPISAALSALPCYWTLRDWAPGPIGYATTEPTWQLLHL